jgi:hypothetical protein
LYALHDHFTNLNSNIKFSKLQSNYYTKMGSQHSRQDEVYIKELLDGNNPFATKPHDPAAAESTGRRTRRRSANCKKPGRSSFTFDTKAQKKSSPLGRSVTDSSIDSNRKSSDTKLQISFSNKNLWSEMDPAMVVKLLEYYSSVDRTLADEFMHSIMQVDGAFQTNGVVPKAA